MSPHCRQSAASHLRRGYGFGHGGVRVGKWMGRDLAQDVVRLLEMTALSHLLDQFRCVGRAEWGMLCLHLLPHLQGLQVRVGGGGPCGCPRRQPAVASAILG